MPDGNVLQPRVLSRDATGPRGRRQLRTIWYACACSLIAIASAATLSWVTGPATTGAELTRSISSLADSWDAPSATSLSPGHFASVLPAVAVNLGSHRPAHPTSGDEGFWLSRHDITGSTAGSVSLGDRITISSKASDAAASDAALHEHIFEVVELKPLVEVAGAVAVASHEPRAALKTKQEGAQALTLVICRELTTGSGVEPRVVRFLMEGAAAPSQPVGSTVQPPRGASAL